MSTIFIEPIVSRPLNQAGGLLAERDPNNIFPMKMSKFLKTFY